MRRIKYGIIVLIAVVSMISAVSSVNSIFLKDTSQKTNLLQYEYYGPELEISTDKTVYQPGEEVQIFFKNIGDELLCGGGPTVTIYNEENEIIYQLASYCYWELEPGEFMEWPPWDQTNFQDEQVEVGSYVIEGLLTGNDEVYIDTTTIYISYLTLHS